MDWPQLSVAAWLSITIAAGVLFTLRPRSEWVVLDPDRQRVVSGALALAGITEALLLCIGGFFGRIL